MRLLRESAVERVLDGRHDAARDQQGDVRRMSRPAVIGFEPPPSAAVEIAARPGDRGCRRSARQGGTYVVAGYAGRSRCHRGGSTPALNAPNIHDAAALVAALRSRARHARSAPAPHRAGDSRLRREGLAAALREGAGAGADLDQLIRWQMRKAAPFKPEEAQISWVPGVALPHGGREFLVTFARRDVIESYERVCAAAGAHAGHRRSRVAESDQRGAGRAWRRARRRADWLLVHVAPDYSTLAIVRGRDLIFFRTRPAERDEDLADLVHQTAMYHEDRLGGGGFARVVLPGASARGAEMAEPASAVTSRPRRLFASRRWISAARSRSWIASRPGPSCSTRWRPPLASSFASGSRSASHQPCHPTVLQRARRARAIGLAAS